MDRALNVLHRVQKISHNLNEPFALAEILPAVANDSLWPIISRKIDELELKYVPDDANVSRCLNALEPTITSVESALRYSSYECNNYHPEVELRELVLSCCSNSSLVNSERQQHHNQNTVLSQLKEGSGVMSTQDITSENVITKYTSILSDIHTTIKKSDVEIANIKKYLFQNYPLDSDFNGALNCDIHACIEQLFENQLLMAEISVLKDVVEKTEVIKLLAKIFILFEIFHFYNISMQTQMIIIGIDIFSI